MEGNSQAPKHPFTFVPANDASKELIKTNLKKCSDLYDFLMTLPPSRERACAITNLEQASMWANKAIAFSQEDAV